MPKALIKVSYKHKIDSSATTDFEKNILHYSYEEYKMKQQAYNPDGSIEIFTALKAKDGRANSLHYKAGFAIMGIVEKLNKSITIMQDGEPHILKFDIHRLEIIESNINNPKEHKVAIHYITGNLILYEIIGNYLLVAYDENGNPSKTLTSPNMMPQAVRISLISCWFNIKDVFAVETR